MSLIKCPECGHNLSSQAIECPHCGIEFSNNLIDFTAKQAAMAREQEQIALGNLHQELNKAAIRSTTPINVIKSSSIGMLLAVSILCTNVFGVIAIIFIAMCFSSYNENGKIRFSKQEGWIPFVGVGSIIGAGFAAITAAGLFVYVSQRKNSNVTAAEREVAKARSLRYSVDMQLNETMQRNQQKRLEELRKKREAGQNLSEEERQEIADIQLGLWKPKV